MTRTTQVDIPDAISALAARDRLQFLGSLDAQTLRTGSLLDLQHQTIFRVLAEEQRHGMRATIQRYLEVPTSRVLLWEAAKAVVRTSWPVNGADTTSSTVDGSRLSGGFSFRSPVAEDAGELIRALETTNPTAICFWSPAGFGYFPAERARKVPSLGITLVDGSSYTSVGGMMYYGFNARPGSPPYVQTHPIFVLGETVAALIAHAGSPLIAHAGSQGEARSPHDHCLRELSAYGRETNDWQDRVERDILEFIAGHERGHDPRCPGNQLLFDVMDACGISRDDHYRVAFPSAHDLGAWNRIKCGKGTPRDVLFLMGDLLANMAYLEQGIAPPVLRLIRAFNWWLVKTPSPRRRPRGLTTFLMHTYRYDRSGFAQSMGELLEAAARRPEQLPDRLYRFEVVGWESLQRLVSSGPPRC